MIAETCPCGATFTCSDDADDMEFQRDLVTDWRANHHHEAAVSAAIKGDNNEPA